MKLETVNVDTTPKVLMSVDERAKKLLTLFPIIVYFDDVILRMHV